MIQTREEYLKDTLQAAQIDESHIEYLRRHIVLQYDIERYAHSAWNTEFGPILCYELRTNGLYFAQLAKKWGISLIKDHCKRLEKLPIVNHSTY